MEAIPISALEHWSYCPRQCALIHVEGTYTDNVLTVRGAHAHERVHSGVKSSDNGIRVTRGMTLWSDEIGLIGRADAVEFRPSGPVPIEYKVGHPGPWKHADLQLAAQAMCLEEMLGVVVPEGHVYYHAARERNTVRVDDTLRATVRNAVVRVRELLAGTSLPPALDDAHCPQCSLSDVCLPALATSPQRLRLLHTRLFVPLGNEG